MIRRLMPAYLVGVACYVAFSLLQDLGPPVEARYFPVRVDQVVDRIDRTGARLCWDWSGRKVRALASDNMDLFIHVNDGEGSVGSVFAAETGDLWRPSAAPAVGPVRKRYCVTLPPRVTEYDSVRIEWRAWYPSGTGLWRFSLSLPEILSPGTSP